ncbi:SAM-dependent methyltransferase, MidA family [Pseudorhodobacter antarcticus]|uniref:SAM-dependent methyltransferase, MidA family n=1 Tax=Pseudorhodobacter antarcticus TaxID=1077947 RepID=A0A1H8FYX8_9RHOB|nr:SAM-dependent methyltransferase [Pseudorhodobacter antarcticus]SEN36720.1 SAM-dependent methyltransferase, MidA family [Pseudorhodobacter antarcticus]
MLPDTTLESLLLAQIAANGPLPLADYMQACLLHPDHGYYTTRDPLGRAGDFITSPEISQMFGELLGLCLAQAWVDQGAPARFVLAELGPGRGTLMADLLRATRGVPGFHAAAEVWLVEASTPLRAAQRAALPGAVHWADNLGAVPDDAPIYLIANEFFDALPIRQVTRHVQGWCDTIVGAADGRLVKGYAPPLPFAVLDGRLADTNPGDVVELRPDATPIMARIGAQIAGHGGAAVIIDYGNWRSKGDTLQAMQGHAFADPFTAPGHADLTAHVDFEALALAADPARATGLTDQGALLARLGIGARAERLARGVNGAALENHLAATQRLTRAEEMGSLFKALALFPPHAPAPPGFD